MPSQSRQGLGFQWIILSIVLSFVVHLGPVCFFFFGPVYGLPQILELDLETINFYRQRVFRHAQNNTSAQQALVIPPPLSLRVTIPSQPEHGERVSMPRQEEDLHRARVVQKAIQNLWEKMPARQTGSAIVSLNLRSDGSLGDYAVHHLSGGEEFQTFLFDFLSALKASYGHQAGPGEPLWIECEFLVKSLPNKNS